MMIPQACNTGLLKVPYSTVTDREEEDEEEEETEACPKQKRCPQVALFFYGFNPCDPGTAHIRCVPSQPLSGSLANDPVIRP